MGWRRIQLRDWRESCAATKRVAERRLGGRYEAKLVGWEIGGMVRW
jgi:hypothetical protein